MTAKYGEIAGRMALQRILAPVADQTAMQAVQTDDRFDGQVAVKLDDYTVWTFEAGSSAGASSSVIVPDAGTGRWVKLTTAVVGAVQGGTDTLAAGTKTVTATITASSRIIVTMKDPGAGAITNFAAFDVPAASRNVGAGTFVVNAIDNAKAVINTAVCTFDYIILG